jgi:galactose-1-phosphate uridylyltransferase
MELYVWNVWISKVSSVMRRIVLPIVFAVFYPHLDTTYKFRVKDTRANTYDSEGRCNFCQIAAATDSEKLIYHDKSLVAFYDRKHIATCHIQIIPIKHIENIFSLTAQDEELVQHMGQVGR